jgi:hypothetical protein
MVEEKTEQLNNMVAMLNGTTEDAVVSLTIIDRLLHSNPAIALLSYKFSECDYSLWKEHAPETYAYVKEICGSGVRVPAITFDQIYNKICEIDKEHEYEMFFKHMSLYLTKTCLGMGHKFMNNVEIKMKTK